MTTGMDGMWGRAGVAGSWRAWRTTNGTDDRSARSRMPTGLKSGTLDGRSASKSLIPSGILEILDRGVFMAVACFPRFGASRISRMPCFSSLAAFDWWSFRVIVFHRARYGPKEWSCNQRTRGGRDRERGAVAGLRPAIRCWHARDSTRGRSARGYAWLRSETHVSRVRNPLPRWRLWVSITPLVTGGALPGPFSTTDGGTRVRLGAEELTSSGY